ncbi:MAG: malto-oligosyltrehalose synthase [Gemmatimonadales bacterium]|jgi:(1->4)-alpha-D-glucan 1-alpha-D-glucosylmutase
METVLSTYRVQLNKDFRLVDLQALVPYLSQLGISHVYVSPILRARAGSGHGYDVVDPRELNPEIGSESELQELVTTLRAHGMGLVLDIVPNHMATGRENDYWEDVLAHGRSSPFADWFDIDWGPADARRPYRVFLPVLGDRLTRVIGRHEIQLTYDAGAFRFTYYDQCFPVDPATVPLIMDLALAEVERQPRDSDRSILVAINARLGSLPPRSSRSPDIAIRRRESARAAMTDLETLYDASADARSCIDAALSFLNSPAGARQLRRLLAGQAYRLAYWRRGAREINYRRFFTISHLVGLRMEDPVVFEQTHSRVLDWIRHGWVDGLRLDHIDGLLDPTAYLERLRDSIDRVMSDRGSAGIPIYVEKILARDEHLPEEWPVAGTTGYDFLNEVEDILLDPNGYWSVDAIYGRFTRHATRFADIARRSKRKILAGHLAAECRRLAVQLERLAGDQSGTTRAELLTAITETIACLRVYRTYLDQRRTSPRSFDVRTLTRAINRASSLGRAANTALELLQRALLPPQPTPADDEQSKARLEFTQRFQQLCVSAAAKGVEDTALYIHVPLVSRNEVGGNPGEPFPGAREALHRANLQRAERWPTGLLCTSTHDTKRSADLRARLDVISELPDLWGSRLQRWHRLNHKHRVRVQGRYAPDRNTEYLFYETLIGLWPRTQLDGSRPAGETLRQVETRIADYMRKAAREAKRQTSWVEPNPEFEAALDTFVRAALSLDSSSRFMSEVDGFVRRVDQAGRWNALARTAIHLTAPGTPDTYQGDEIWNYSLVDPDNRRPVDYGLRKARLGQTIVAWERASEQDRPALVRSLAQDPTDDRLKLWVVHRALQTRRAHADLFRRGSYEPLIVTGPQSGHLFAFFRGHLDRSAVTVVALRSASLPGNPSAPPIGQVWTGTELRLPLRSGAGGWRCALSGAFFPRPPGGETRVPVDRILGSLPVALLLPEGHSAGAPDWEPA